MSHHSTFLTTSIFKRKSLAFCHLGQIHNGNGHLSQLLHSYLLSSSLLRGLSTLRNHTVNIQKEVKLFNPICYKGTSALRSQRERLLLLIMTHSCVLAHVGIFDIFGLGTAILHFNLMHFAKKWLVRFHFLDFPAQFEFFIHVLFLYFIFQHQLCPHILKGFLYALQNDFISNLF